MQGVTASAAYLGIGIKRVYGCYMIMHIMLDTIIWWYDYSQYAQKF